MRAVANATTSFLVIRLALGLFGHDLYEVYWWFCAGLVISLSNMCGVARQRTEALALRPNSISENI
jgi:hypothetical protein